jgi:phosphohistidine phosphatase
LQNRILYEHGHFAIDKTHALQKRLASSLLFSWPANELSAPNGIGSGKMEVSAGVNVYLVRHGEAVSEQQDSQRPLTVSGREAVAQVARMAASKDVQVSAIFHSGILRAKQTAEILAEALRFPSGVQQLSGLRPQDDPAIAKAELDAAESPIMVVGHLPHLNRLLGLLLSGDPESQIMEFPPATMVCCSNDTSKWKVSWTLPSHLS